MEEHKACTSQESLPCFSQEAQAMQVGSIYSHYKGLLYKIVGIARHSETLEELVVYQALYGEKEMWVRPLTMFLEEVEIQGQRISRFTLVKPFT